MIVQMPLFCLRHGTVSAGLESAVLNLVTGLGLGLAIDYSLFVVYRYREELARCGHCAEALERTLGTAGRTVAFSSLTVSVALLSLLVFPQRMLSTMGIAAAIVTLESGAINGGRDRWPHAPLRP